MRKVYYNIEKLEDVDDFTTNFNLDTAKACHSLLHNLIEHYKLEDEADEKVIQEILYNLGGAFGFLSELTWGQFLGTKVYRNRLVIPPAKA